MTRVSPLKSYWCFTFLSSSLSLPFSAAMSPAVLPYHRLPSPIGVKTKQQQPQQQRSIEHRKSKKRRTQTQYFLFLSCSSQVICYSNVKLPNADILMVIKCSPCGFHFFIHAVSHTVLGQTLSLQHKRKGTDF